MKRSLVLVFFVILACQAYTQQNNSTTEKVDRSYFVTHNREDLIRKLVDLPYGIKPDDPEKLILQKLQTFLTAFQPSKEFSDDVYAKAANLQALKSVMQGGYSETQVRSSC